RICTNPDIPPTKPPILLSEGRARNCKELHEQGETLTGWYTIYPIPGKVMVVFCDMEVDGGGWL
ncbi:hypothetical protein E2320_021314, partial [Naja naja]